MDPKALTRRAEDARGRARPWSIVPHMRSDSAPTLRQGARGTGFHTAETIHAAPGEPLETESKRASGRRDAGARRLGQTFSD